MTDIAFVGVGRMAAPMVERFLDQGWHAHLTDPRAAATEPFGSHDRVTVHADLTTIARAAEVILLSLPDAAALLEVSTRLAAAAPATATTVVVNTSTAGVDATRTAAAEIRAAGMAFVDAPVSGGPAGARRGTLTVIAAGDPDVIARCGPVFDVISEQLLHVGPEPGQAQVMKVANNVLSLGALAATAEATALTSKAGIALDVAIDVLNASSGRNSATAHKIPDNVLTGRYDFGFPVAGALKDVTLFTDLAGELDVPAPLAEAVRACWDLAVRRGLGQLDCTHITTMYDELAGLPVDDGAR
jgi:3-hydroxyisobutyrate dehydrogenase-like beta-hydroxyacid dehydrogenase